jgi:hypothetical protein
VGDRIFLLLLGLELACIVITQNYTKLNIAGEDRKVATYT